MINKITIEKLFVLTTNNHFLINRFFFFFVKSITTNLKNLVEIEMKACRLSNCCKKNIYIF